MFCPDTDLVVDGSSSSVPFRSVQFKMVSRRSEKPICAPPRLSEVSRALPLKRVHHEARPATSKPGKRRRLRGLQAGTSEAAVKTCMGRLWDQSGGGRHPVAARHPPPPPAAAAADRVSAEWARGRCVDQCQRVNTGGRQGAANKSALLSPWASGFFPRHPATPAHPFPSLPPPPLGFPFL